MWKGAKLAGILSKENRDEPILVSADLSMCILYMCPKRMEIKSK